MTINVILALDKNQVYSSILGHLKNLVLRGVLKVEHSPSTKPTIIKDTMVSKELRFINVTSFN